MNIKSLFFFVNHKKSNRASIKAVNIHINGQIIVNKYQKHKGKRATRNNNNNKNNRNQRGDMKRQTSIITYFGDTVIVSQMKWLTCRCLSGQLIKKNPTELRSSGHDNKAHKKGTFHNSKQESSEPHFTDSIHNHSFVRMHKHIHSHIFVSRLNYKYQSKCSFTCSTSGEEENKTCNIRNQTAQT